MATLGGAPSLSQGGGGSAVGGSAAAVPEPGTLALLAVGAIGLVGVCPTEVEAALTKGGCEWMPREFAGRRRCLRT